MTTGPLHIFPTTLLPAYCEAIPGAQLRSYEDLQDSELSVEAFSFYTSVAAVYSSKIEGEDIELDSYVKYKRFGVEFRPDYTRKIDDLYDAYQFAKTHSLNRENLESAHGLLTRNMLPNHQLNIILFKSDDRHHFPVSGPVSLGYVRQKMGQIARCVPIVYRHGDFGSLAHRILSSLNNLEP